MCFLSGRWRNSLNIVWKASCFKRLQVKKNWGGTVHYELHTICWMSLYIQNMCTVMVWFLRPQRLRVSKETTQEVSEAPRTWEEDRENYDRTQNLFKTARFLDLSILVYPKKNRFWEMDVLPTSGEMVGSQLLSWVWEPTSLRLCLEWMIEKLNLAQHAHKEGHQTGRNEASTENWHQQGAEEITIILDTRLTLCKKGTWIKVTHFSKIYTITKVSWP